MTDNHSREDNIAARLALALDSEPAAGKKPDLAEISAWHRGELDPNRAEEVRSHVARDSECYQMWYELRQAEQERLPKVHDTSVSLTDRLTDWFSSLLSPLTVTAFAGVAVVTLLALVLWPLSSTDPLGSVIDQEYAQWPSEKTPGREETLWGEVINANTVAARGEGEKIENDARVVRVGLRSGIRAGLRSLTSIDPDWSPVIESLADDGVACSKRDDPVQCAGLKLVMYQTGRWALLAHFNCMITGDDTPGRAGQIGILDQLLKESEAQGATPEVVDILSGLRQMAPEATDAFCPQVGQLLNLAVRAE